MATTSDCGHKLHKNIIEYQGYWIEQDYTFILIDETMFIIDTINKIRKCPQCGTWYRVYIYGEWPDVRASFDGVTDLPICTTVDNIKTFVKYISVFSEPRLGKKFIYGVNYDQFEIYRYFIMDCINSNIDSQLQRTSYGNIFIDNKIAVCCMNNSDEFVLINIDGHIIEAEVVHSESSDAFKIGNGYLISTRGETRWDIVWQYISAPALNTKPAAASASGFDE